MRLQATSQKFVVVLYYVVKQNRFCSGLGAIQWVFTYNGEASDVALYGPTSLFHSLCRAVCLVARRPERNLQNARPAVRRYCPAGRAYRFTSGLEGTALHCRIHERRRGLL